MQTIEKENQEHPSLPENAASTESDAIYIEKQIREPGFVMPYEHAHNYCEIFYLKTGRCSYYINNHTHHLEAGNLFLIKPGELHSTSYEGTVPCERYAVSCTPQSLPPYFLEQHGELAELFTTSCKVLLRDNGKRQIETLLARMSEENSPIDEYAPEFMRLFLMQLLLCIRRSGTFIYEHNHDRENLSTDIEEALCYIDQNYAHAVTLSEVAQQVSLSPAWLSSKFKTVTGITFKEYLTRLRIRQATQALLTTDDSITKIALDCGFNSSNYFKDCFRKEKGHSPREYRKEGRKRPLQ